MDSPFAAAIAAAVEQGPMSNGPVSKVPGRLLLADGDGLCYYCAGNDETSPGTARNNLIEKLRSAARACGAERVRILMTARGSHKGHRYAVARSKPYQGARTDSRRPKNWQFLREFIEGAHPLSGFEVEFSHDAEADDLFAQHAATNPNVVIYTQDKDMRMVDDCYHLDWLTHIMYRLPKGTWSATHGEKVYGRHWFWMQMLHGDAVDNIPGLPWYTDGRITKTGPNKGQVTIVKCGEKSTAVLGLAQASSDMSALLHCQPHYQSCYKDRWLVEMLEQGVLLWMRKVPSDPFDVVQKGNPLHALTTHELYPAARAEIAERINQAINAQTESDGSISDEGCAVDSAGGPVPSVPTPVQPAASGAGSLSYIGQHSSCAASDLQRVDGKGGELLQAVRRALPAGVPSWTARLLAKA